MIYAINSHHLSYCFQADYRHTYVSLIPQKIIISCNNLNNYLGDIFTARMKIYYN